MPSIIEVDTIKNKTGTQNTVLSTDGSGNNTLNAGVIKSNTGSNTGLSIASDGQVTIAQNNPTITLGSNTTFPDGMVTNFIHRQLAFDTNGSYSIQASTGGAVVKIAIRGTDGNTEVPSFTAKQGFTYQFVFHFRSFTDQNAGVNSSGRNTKFDLYYGTTPRSQGGTTYDTRVYRAPIGRDSPAATTASASSKFAVVLMGAFYQSASDATTYVYFTGEGTDNGKRVTVYHSTLSPAHLFITEYKGNLSTILT